MNDVSFLHGPVAEQGCRWTPGEGGVLTSEAGPCRLTVATIGGLSRYLVHRQEPDRPGCPLPLLESGTRPDALVAMAAAEAAAARIAAAAGPRPKAEG